MFRNDMTLSAKDIKKNFLFGSEMPLEQLSADSVKNASSLFVKSPTKKEQYRLTGCAFCNSFI